jgi:hypothetical protein
LNLAAGANQEPDSQNLQNSQESQENLEDIVQETLRGAAAALETVQKGQGNQGDLIQETLRGAVAVLETATSVLEKQVEQDANVMMVDGIPVLLSDPQTGMQIPTAPLETAPTTLPDKEQVEVVHDPRKKYKVQSSGIQVRQFIIQTTFHSDSLIYMLILIGSFRRFLAQTCTLSSLGQMMKTRFLRIHLIFTLQVCD